MKEQTCEIVYTWQDGREEVRYRRDYPSDGATKLIEEIKNLPNYSYRIV